MCSPSDLSYPFPLAFMTWDEDEWAYRTNRAGFTAMLKDLDRQAREQGMRVGMLAH